MEKKTIRFVPLGLLGTLGVALSCLAFALAKSEADAPPSDFLRFVKEGKGEGRLETAVVMYEKGEVRVSLLGAVHVGDRAYYDQLQKLFEGYDALLYEMIKEKDEEVRPVEGRPESLVSMFQRGLKGFLELDFQLDAIDYTQENFVHADMDPETFLRLQKNKGESMASLMFRAMLEEWKRQLNGQGSKLNGWTLLAAFASPDSARSLKYLLAKEFDSVERILAGMDGGDDGSGSVLLSGRNEVAMEVLRRELKNGKKNLGIFYGAGHMQDLERRVRKLGFKKVTAKWVTAWDIKKKRAPVEPEADGAQREPNEN